MTMEQAEKANVLDALRKTYRISYKLRQIDFSICLFSICDNLGFPFANKNPLNAKLFIILLFNEGDVKKVI